jgi:hypothetical protein
MVDEETLGLLAVFGHPFLGFEVLVEQRQREVVQVEQRFSAPASLALVPAICTSILLNDSMRELPATARMRGVMVITPL